MFQVLHAVYVRRTRSTSCVKLFQMKKFINDNLAFSDVSGYECVRNETCFLLEEYVIKIDFGLKY